MRLIRSSAKKLAWSISALTIAATVANAEDRTLFTWFGTVDREVIITMRGREVDTRGDFQTFGRARVDEALPRVPGAIRAYLADGRGEVDVIEQPSPMNGFTARVRVRDPRFGADRYRLIVAWTGFRDGRGPGRDDNCVYGRDDVRDKGNGHDNGYGRGRDNRDYNNCNDRDHNPGWNDRGRNNGRLHWSGEVDDVAEIRIQGRDVQYFSRNGAPLRGVKAEMVGAGLSPMSGDVELASAAGRGRAYVVQQPNARNAFTAVIRVDDSRGGYGFYDLDIRW